MKKTALIFLMILATLHGVEKTNPLIWPYISTKPPVTQDQLLRGKAHKAGMRSIPSDWNSLLEFYRSQNITIDSKLIPIGKKLFFDPRLSKSQSISCATCHMPDQGGADGLPTAIGHQGLPNPSHLNTPTVFNSALAQQFFWDGRSHSLAHQAKGPIQAGFEMASTPEEVKQIIHGDSDYQKLFLLALGKPSVSFDDITQAIAEYEKTLLTRGRFDRYLDGDNAALNPQEKRGMEMFIDLGCISCHAGMALGGQEMRKFPNRRHQASLRTQLAHEKKLLKEYEKFSNTPFQHEENRHDYLLLKFGQKDLDYLLENYFAILKEGQQQEALTKGCRYCHANPTKMKKLTYPFENKGGFLGKNNTRFFRTPILRNIAQTAPYFHNGSVEKLEDAVMYMGRHQLGRELTKIQINNIVAFLKALDGILVDYGF